MGGGRRSCQKADRGRRVYRQTGATDKEDDHQPSAPAVLHDVLTAVSIGGSRTELIDALTAIKPKFGAHGSRDVDVRAAHAAIDKAIEKLSNL